MPSPHPAQSPGLLRIPAPGAQQVHLRFAPLLDRDRFDPPRWRAEPLLASGTFEGWWEVDLDGLALADGEYEYEFVVDGRTTVADPYAEEITRFGGYRGLFRAAAGRRVRQEFRWGDELPQGVRLPENNEIVIYEMPLRWMSSAPEAKRQMDLGTFDRVIFERLDELAELGVNAIELLPVQDSPATLSWGYGTRFFFAPDFDMGGPVDARLFVKRCHQRGIRVILDVVMNHAPGQCPLAALAPDWYFLQEGESEGDRNGWGSLLFRLRDPRPAGYFAAREFHYEMAEYWVREYRVDGFRLDEFKSINNWDFVQTFRERAWRAHLEAFPGRPFLVVAEDSNRRFETTRDEPANPNGRKVVDAIWNFSYQDEGRRLLTNQIRTQFGRPSRSERVRALVSGRGMWDDYWNDLRGGYGDTAQSVNYLTSHDVQDVPRLMNYIFGDLLRTRSLGDGEVDNVRGVVDDIASQNDAVKAAHAEALERVRSSFALLLTSVGIPMFLAGEEFADVHDLNYGEADLKMSDPVDWGRREEPGRRTLYGQVAELVRLRTSHPALRRNEVEFFYFHPDTDGDEGASVFAYCRTGGLPLGSPGQVAVLANCGAQDFPVFEFPWHWPAQGAREVAVPLQGSAPQFPAGQSRFRISLAPFQLRVIVCE